MLAKFKGRSGKRRLPIRWRLLLGLVLLLSLYLRLLHKAHRLLPYAAIEEKKVGCSGIECCIDRGDGRLQCIVAEIEIQDAVKIQLWDHRKKGSWRLRQQVSEAVARHPNVRWIVDDDNETPDIILWLPSLAANPPENLRDASRSLIVLDEHDLPAPKGLDRSHGHYVAFFKRSFATKRDGRLIDSIGSLSSMKKQAEHYFPFQYALSDAYLGKSMHIPESFIHRPYALVCTLRVGRGQYQARARVLNWTREAMLADSSLLGYAGEFDKGSRLDINHEYFALMRHAKIVITTQPGEWDGDFRGLEAFASGALVFADTALSHAPSPHPFIHGTHYIQFEPTQGNRKDFLKKLRYYLDRPQLAQQIASNGFEHALKYHRSISRLDWILRSAFTEAHGIHYPPYNETARAVLAKTPRIVHDAKNYAPIEILDASAIRALRLPLDRRKLT